MINITNDTTITICEQGWQNRVILHIIVNMDPLDLKTLSQLIAPCIHILIGRY